MLKYPVALVSSLCVASSVLAHSVNYFDARVPLSRSNEYLASSVILTFGLESDHARIIEEYEQHGHSELHAHEPDHEPIAFGFAPLGATEHSSGKENPFEAGSIDRWLAVASEIRLKAPLGFDQEAGIGANVRYRLAYPYGANHAKRLLGDEYTDMLQTVQIDNGTSKTSNLSWFQVHQEDEQVFNEHYVSGPSSTLKAAYRSVRHHDNGLIVVYADQRDNLHLMNYPVEEITLDPQDNIVFLAGPTDHKVPVTSWREDVIKRLSEQDLPTDKKTIVVVPEYVDMASAGFKLANEIDGVVVNEGIEQIRWERTMMERATEIVFNLDLSWEKTENGVKTRGNIGPTVRAEVGYWLGFNETLLKYGRPDLLKKIRIAIPKNADNVDWVLRHHKTIGSQQPVYELVSSL
jgi:hypothetical protein